jgi:hypothetical protein
MVGFGPFLARCRWSCRRGCWKPDRRSLDEERRVRVLGCHVHSCRPTVTNSSPTDHALVSCWVAGGGSGLRGRSRGRWQRRRLLRRVPLYVTGRAGGPVCSSSWQELWVIVVPVMDGSHTSLAGRVGLPLAVLLALLWGGNSAQPGMTGAPPAQQPAVRATLKLQYDILGHHVHVVQPAARHGQGNRRGFTPVAMLAAALAGAVVATSRREQVSCSRRLDGRLLALRPRAPPSCRP